MNYSFEASNNVELIALTGKLMNIVELANPHYSEAVTELYGKLLAVFGEPAETSKSLESAYLYVVTAKGEDGSDYVLSVYEGPTGPAIGGKKMACEAAQELKKYIESAQPMDYEYEGYYFDGPTKVHRGVANGKAFIQK